MEQKASGNNRRRNRKQGRNRKHNQEQSQQQNQAQNQKSNQDLAQKNNQNQAQKNQGQNQKLTPVQKPTSAQKPNPVQKQNQQQKKNQSREQRQNHSRDQRQNQSREQRQNQSREQRQNPVQKQTQDQVSNLNQNIERVPVVHTIAPKTDTVLRGERETDFPDIYEVNKLAFGDEAESQLIENLRKTRNYIKGLSVVLIKEEKLIGHAMLTQAHIINRGRRFNCLALAPVAIHPEFQRKGFGTKVVEEAILRATECGYKAIVVVGDSAYYSRFGFIPASTKKIRSRFTNDDNFMILELTNNALKGIVGLAEYAREFNLFLPKKTEDKAAEESQPTTLEDTLDSKTQESITEVANQIEVVDIGTQKLNDAENKNHENTPENTDS